MWTDPARPLDTYTQKLQEETIDVITHFCSLDLLLGWEGSSSSILTSNSFSRGGFSAASFACSSSSSSVLGITWFGEAPPISLPNSLPFVDSVGGFSPNLSGKVCDCFSRSCAMSLGVRHCTALEWKSRFPQTVRMKETGKRPNSPGTSCAKESLDDYLMGGFKKKRRYAQIFKQR